MRLERNLHLHRAVCLITARNATLGVILTCVGPDEGGRTLSRQLIEELAKGTPAWYAGTRAKVEARADLEQAEELRRVLEDLGRG
jgi:hypothetical protein